MHKNAKIGFSRHFATKGGYKRIIPPTTQPKIAVVVPTYTIKNGIDEKKFVKKKLGTSKVFLNFCDQGVLKNFPS